MFCIDPRDAHSFFPPLQVDLAKTQSMSDWSHRPLSAAQLGYAAEDVRYLLPLHDELTSRLESLGRVNWFQEEMTSFNSDAARGSLAKPLDPYNEAWKKVRGAHKLDATALAVLSSLAAWRAEKAVKLNKNPNALVADRILLALSMSQPVTRAEIETQRLPKNVERDIDGILGAVVFGKLLAKKQEAPLEHRWNSEVYQGGDRAIEHLLQASLHSLAQEHSIAPGLCAGWEDMRMLSNLSVSNETLEDLDLKVLRQGWRRQLIGDPILSAREGLLSPTVSNGRVELLNRQGATVQPSEGPY